MQVDFFMPERLDISYVGEDGDRHRPVMLHRAVLGSFERFIGILLENHAGELPLWLAPTQAVLMNITDSQADYVEKLGAELALDGFRVQADLRNEKVGYKIRQHTLAKVPYLLVAGDKEMAANQIAVRTRAGDDLGVMDVSELKSRLAGEVALLGRKPGSRAIRRGNMRGAPAAPRHMINEAIRSPQVRLIGPNGDQIGVVATRDAIVAAKENDLDLVMISENADPPVAKIMDYGKKLYEDKKAKSEAKKKQVQTKQEIKFRPGTDDGDYKIKVKHMIEFLEHGDKVKVTIRFRGREMAHQDLGVKLLNRVEEELAELANVESRPALEGRQMVMVFAPKSRKGKS